MAGMLSENDPNAEDPQAQSGPGPGADIPPGGSPASGAESGPGQPPETEEGKAEQEMAEHQEKEGPSPGTQELPPTDQLVGEAVQLVYGERFDQLVEMFQGNGPDRYARSVGLTVNTAIEELEKQYGQLPVEAAAQVGTQIYLYIIEDTLTGDNPIMTGVPMQQIQETLPAVMAMYAEKRPNVSKEDMEAVLMEVMKQGSGGQQAEPGAEQAPPPEQAPPAEQPPADPAMMGGM